MCRPQIFSTLRGLVCSLSLFTERSHLNSFLLCLFSLYHSSPSLSHACRPCTSDFSSHIQDLQRSHLSVMIYLVSCFDRTTSSASSVVQAPCPEQACNLQSTPALLLLHQVGAASDMQLSSRLLWNRLALRSALPAPPAFVHDPFFNHSLIRSHLNRPLSRTSNS